MTELREKVAEAIEVTRATIERDIPAEQRGQVYASATALADAILDIPEIRLALEVVEDKLKQDGMLIHRCTFTTTAPLRPADEA